MSWASAPLGEICDIQIGRTPSRSEQSYWSGGTLPWVSISDMRAEVVDKTKECITEKGAQESGARLVAAGTLLMSFKLSIGKLAFAGTDLYTNEAIAALRLLTNKVDTRYLMRALGRMNFDSAGNRAVMGNTLNKASLSNIDVPLPPLDEQQRIAKILDKADALRRKRKRAVSLLDSLNQAIFLEMFGDPIGSTDRKAKAIGEVIRQIESGWSPVCLDRPAIDDEAGVLKLSAVTSSEFLANENKALPPELQPKAGTEVEAGDILFCRKNTRELVGSSVYVWNTRPKLYMSDLIFRIVPEKSTIDPIFLQAQLALPSLRNKISTISGGAAGSMPNVSKSKLREVEVIVPQLKAQKAFAVAVCTERVIG